MSVRWSMLLFGLISAGARGYDVADHKAITERALEISVFTSDDSKRARLGFERPPTDARVTFLDSKHQPRSVVNLISAGAAYEDDNSRPINHFFDPTNNTGLQLSVGPRYPFDWLPAGAAALNAVAQASPNWSLDSSKINRFDYLALKEFHFRALTAPTSSERSDAVGLMFESLGRIVHHIQDMAQPQHVRNDMHWSDEQLESCADYTDAALRLKCDAYLTLSSPSSYERWTLSLNGDLPLAGYAPVYGPGSGLSTLKVPRDFWTGGGRGLAEFTNRNFVSAGTMFVSPPALTGEYDVRAGDLCVQYPPCDMAAADLDRVVTFWQNVVDDRLRVSSSWHRHAAAASIFEWDLRTVAPTGQRPFTVNRATFKDDLDFLLPRAVGYSAGFINYFFRGDMEFLPPNEGVFAVTDTHPLACGLPCGFRTVKLKLKNTTPGEVMGAGILRVVAKYRLNGCYYNDLSGEDGGPQFKGKLCRSEEDYLAVSDPQSVDGVPNDRFLDLTFFFPPGVPIPINASDLSLQIVFRGKLGAEDDAIAVSTQNVREPNFVAVGNITDYEFGDKYYAPLPSGTAPLMVNSVTFAFQDPATAPPLASLAGLGAGEHAQFAFISDRTVRNYWLRTQMSDGVVYDENAPLGLREFYLDEPTDKYGRTCPVTGARGPYRDFFRYYAQLAHAKTGQHGAALVIGGDKVAEKGLTRKYAADCYYAPAPGTGGLEDVSYLTPPFGADNVKRWTLPF